MATMKAQVRELKNKMELLALNKQSTAAVHCETRADAR